MEKYKITLDYVQNKSANRAYKHFFKNDLLTGKKSILLEGYNKIFIPTIAKCAKEKLLRILQQ